MIKNNFKKRAITSLVLLSLLYFAYNINIILAYFLIILGIISILEFTQLIKKINLNKFNSFFINIFFINYVFFVCLIFFILSNFSIIKIIIYITLLGCIASDIGGYVFGKIFKGPKLTKISPNKTYSGALGSIIFCLITISCLFLYVLKIFNFKILAFALTTSFFCQLGDLIFSFLKRKAKLEDTGNFLPGHGGVLDRLDGIFLGLPAGLITLLLLAN